MILPEAEKVALRKRLLNPNMSYLTKKSLRAQILKKAKRLTTCPHCKSLNGMVKKGFAGILKIVHDKYRSKKNSDYVIEKVLGKLKAAKESNKELSSMTHSALLIDMNPLHVIFYFTFTEQIYLIFLTVSFFRFSNCFVEYQK